jgi:prephenate dehydratase
MIDSPNKASIVFSLQHQVGSLVDILTILKCHEINMTKIQSSPIIGKPYEYNFHIDLSWENYYYFKHAMDIVERNVAHLRILGEYKAGAKDY